jgi:acyl-CoA reductase-like NAD-dependent aldehyde dehydrogenase
MSAEPSPETACPADPEHDPTGSFAVDPRLVRRLADRVAATGGEEHTTYAPFTQQPVAALRLSSLADVESAALRARAAQRAWSREPLRRRARVLLDLHDLVLDRQDDLLDLIQWESGKARKHAFEEVAHVAMTAR